MKTAPDTEHTVPMRGEWVHSHEDLRWARVHAATRGPREALVEHVVVETDYEELKSLSTVIDSILTPGTYRKIET